MSLKKYKVWWPDNGQTKEDARIFEDFDHEGAGRPPHLYVGEQQANAKQ